MLDLNLRFAILGLVLFSIGLAWGMRGPSGVFQVLQRWILMLPGLVLLIVFGFRWGMGW